MIDWKQIDGWLEVPEGEKLRELATGKNVFEIGCYKGKSTVCMAKTAKSVVSLDTFRADNSGQTQMENLTTLDEFTVNISWLVNLRIAFRNISRLTWSSLMGCMAFAKLRVRLTSLALSNWGWFGRYFGEGSRKVRNAYETTTCCF